MNSSRDGRLVQSAGLVPSIGLAVLSKFTCSLCLAGYAGVLSSLGLGAIATERGLTVLTAVFVALNLVSLGWATRHHRNLGPLSFALVGSAALLGGRLWWPVPVLLYPAAAVAVIASVWSVWMDRRQFRSFVPLGRVRPAGATSADAT